MENKKDMKPLKRKKKTCKKSLSTLEAARRAEIISIISNTINESKKYIEFTYADEHQVQIFSENL